jgi:hypothetical protein
MSTFVVLQGSSGDGMSNSLEAIPSLVDSLVDHTTSYSAAGTGSYRAVSSDELEEILKNDGEETNGELVELIHRGVISSMRRHLQFVCPDVCLNLN